MAIKSRHSKKIEPNMSSMSDLVFLLLIFFVITSTLVSPNMIRVDLPSSEAGQQNVPRNVEVYVDSLHYFYVNPQEENVMGTMSLDTLAAQLRVAMDEDTFLSFDGRFAGIGFSFLLRSCRMACNYRLCRVSRTVHLPQDQGRSGGSGCIIETAEA